MDLLKTSKITLMQIFTTYLTLSRLYSPWGPVKYDVIFLHARLLHSQGLKIAIIHLKLYNFGQNVLCKV